MKKKIFPLIICSVFIMSACDFGGSSSSSGDGTTSSEPDSSSSINGTYELSSFTLPQAIVDSYKEAYDNREDATKINTGATFAQDRFFITENGGYKVGDDNPFIFLPEVVAFLDDGLNQITLPNYRSVSRVELWTSMETWQELAGTELENFVTIDNQKSTFDFTEDAVGHKFRLNVLPDSHYYVMSSSIRELSFIIEIVDGYNVHDVSELSMLDNSSELWREFKTAHNLSMDLKPNGIILHNNLKITSNDVPAGFFYTENDVVEARMPGLSNYVGPNGAGRSSIVGTLKDFASIYVHDTPEDGEFVFEGNFFTIDGSEIPLVRKFNDKPINEWSEAQGSHASLFGFPADGSGKKEKADDNATENLDVAIPAQPQTPQGIVTIRNMNTIGNGGRDNSGLSNGGVIFMKAGCKTITWENVIASNMFISFFSRKGAANDEPVTSVIKYCKGYDSYNSMVYYWGSTNNTVENSILKRSGGSLFICDEVWDTSTYDTRRFLSNLTTTNCELESYVNGQEPWFVAQNASTAVALLVAMGQIFAGYNTAGVNTSNRNIVKNGKINIIALLVRGDHVFDNTWTELKSTVSINNSSTPLNPNTLINNTYFGPIINGTPTQMVTFESSNGGRGYYNGANDFALVNSNYSQSSFQSVLTDYATNGNNSSSDVLAGVVNISKFFSGDTINLYLKPGNGLKNIGAVFGYK